MTSNVNPTNKKNEQIGIEAETGFKEDNWRVNRSIIPYHRPNYVDLIASHYQYSGNVI